MSLLSPEMPAPAIRDQRVMVGLRQHSSVEEVEAAWEQWASTHGLPVRRRRGDFTEDLHVSTTRVSPYVSGGSWVADCPLCRDAMACWWANPRACCLGCGTIFTVDHPPFEDVGRAHDLLLQRGRPEDRNWHVHRGETVQDLAAENELLQSRGPQIVDGIDVAEILGAVSRLRARGVTV
jgi:hypothetical protein